ncbi:MAG: Ig-like domain-containing protein, partial [Lachnospiraceae bacterium]|nr:Ig-like domain-containing protein [Lachnospiraceae bacterium]
ATVYVVGLSKTKITLHQYESTKINLQLDGTGSANIKVRWDTDNQSIAEIANGKVTGKKLGTTTVYAVVNGRYLPCTVKVIKNT